MGWKDAKEAAAKQSGFVSLKKDKQSVTYVPLTEPAPVEVPGFTQGSVSQKYRVYVSPAPFTDPGNFLILDMGVKEFAIYADTVSEGDEAKKKFKRTRHGKAKSLDTFYSHDPAGKLSTAESKVVKTAAKLAVEAAKVPF